MSLGVPASRANKARPRGGAGAPGRARPATRSRPRPGGGPRRARGHDPPGLPPRRGPARRAPAPGWPPGHGHTPTFVAGLTRRGRSAPVGRPGALDRDACEPYLKAGRAPTLPPRCPRRPGPPLPPPGAPGPQEQGRRRRPAPRPAPRPLRQPSPRPGRRPALGPPPTGRREHRRRLGARQRPPLTPLLSPSKATTPSTPRDTAQQDRILP